MQRYLVEGGTGWAGIAPAGSLLRIIDIDAKQVGDLVLFLPGRSDRQVLGGQHAQDGELDLHYYWRNHVVD